MGKIVKVKSWIISFFIFMVSIGVCLGLCGCSNDIGKKDFHKDGLTITLSYSFSEDEKQEYTAYYTSSKMVVALQKEPFTQTDGVGGVFSSSSLSTLREYVDGIEIEWYVSQGINNWQNGVVEDDGLVYFIYEDDQFGENSTVCCFGYKSADAFWRVYFSCGKTYFETLKNDIFKYAKSVKVDEEFQEILAFEKIEGKEEYRVSGLGTVCSPDVVIPAEYEGLPVTEIASDAFNIRRNAITSVVLPDTITEISRGLFSGMFSLQRVQLGNAVTKIDEYAFHQCYNLVECILPDSVTEIGMEAFAYCSKLREINLKNVRNIDMAAFFQCKALEKLQIPETITSIGYSVFAGCEGLKELSLPETLEVVGRAAFQGCISLTVVVIPDSVTMIENGAFDQCFALENVTIPNSVTSIGYSAFGNCPVLQCTEYEGCLYLGNINNPYLYLLKSSNEEIAFGKTHGQTKIIACNAFSKCYNLMTFEVGESVTEIGHSAFENCHKLLEIYNKSSLVITIGERNENGGIAANAKNVRTEEGQEKLLTVENGYAVFRENESCVLLGYFGAETELVFPSDVTKVDARAFYRRTTIQSITMGDSLREIDEYAFAYCEVKKIQFGNGLSVISDYAFFGSGVGELVLPASLTVIGRCAFAECTNLEKVTFGNSLESIGEEAFRQCSALKKVAIPDSVTSLGSKAFAACRGLQEASVGNQVRAEKLDWFDYCTSLQRLVLGNSLTKVNATAFAYMNSLTSVVIGDLVETIEERAFEDCTSLKEITFGKSLKKIGYSAFQRTGLVEVQLPEGVETLGSMAFSGCVSLKTATLPNSLTKVYNNLFDGCSLLENVTLGNSVTEIQANAFRSCLNLVSIAIPDTIISIDKDAFAYCEGLQYNGYEGCRYLGNEQNPYVALVSVSSQNIVTAKIHPQTKSICDYVFMGCKALTQVSLPNGLLGIGERAFGWCNALKELELPDTVKCVGGEAFSGCTALSSVKLSNSLIEIGDVAFGYCVNIREIHFPSSLEKIGNYAFDNCTGLTSVKIPDSVKYVGSMAFRSCKNLKSATLPQGLTVIESGLFWGCENLTEIVLPDTVTTIGDLAFAECENLKCVYLTGGEISQTVQSLIEANKALLNATTYCYLETEPDLSQDGTSYNGNFWHYVNGVPTVWTYEEELN